MRLYEFNNKHTFDDVNEDWRSALAGVAATGALAMGSPDVDASKPKQTISHQTIDKSKEQTKLLLNDPDVKMLKSHAKSAGITGTELAQFLAQMAHETQNFTRMKEVGKTFKQYDPVHNPSKARRLGNVHAGDGARYHGRGFIQLTGRENYRRAGRALGLPLENQPELAARPDVAAKIAVWYWKERVQPRVDNFHNTAQVTKPINPALKGLADRDKKYQEFLVALTPPKKKIGFLNI